MSGPGRRYRLEGSNVDFVVRDADDARRALPHAYGFELERRKVLIDAQWYEVVTYQSLLAPTVVEEAVTGRSSRPPSEPPKHDVLFLPQVDVLIPRAPHGYSDAEVDRILASLEPG